MKDQKTTPQFTNNLRVRVCGILIEGDKILLVKHRNLGEKGILWIPPGGGVEFGESMESALKREFKEEANLNVNKCDFLFINEFIKKPLHAVELFFEVNADLSNLKTGFDPELEAEEQMIDEVKMMSLEELKSMNQLCLHSAIRNCDSLDDILNRRGFLNFENNP